MTRIAFYEDELVMEIQGHAGYAAAGEDIVCAAVSALAMALFLAAEEPMYQACRHINRQEARVRVSCAPGKGEKRRCREMFRVIGLGFEALQTQYPEYVRYEVR